MTADPSSGGGIHFQADGRPASFDPLDPVDAASPFSALRVLRSQCPVVRGRPRNPDAPPFVLVTRHADVAKVFRDTEHFSHALAVSLDGAKINPKPLEETGLVSIDPPHHTSLRRITIEAINPGVLKQALPEIERIAQATVASFRSRGAADLVHEWALPIPSSVVSMMLGVEPEDRPTFADMAHEYIAESARTGGLGSPRQGEIVEIMAAYFQRLIERHRAGEAGRDDFVARMMRGRAPDGTTMSDRQIAVEGAFVLIAGNDTTGSLLASLMYHLLSRPPLYERLVADRSLVPTAIEEALRFDPPVQHFPVLCKRATDIGGTPVDEGELVLLHMASGSRDEAVFGDDADEFRIDREATGKHFAFGVGPHQCLGAPVARAICRIAVNVLLDEIPSMRLADGFEYEKVDYHQFRGPKRLPAVWDAEAVGHSG